MEHYEIIEQYSNEKTIYKTNYHGKLAVVKQINDIRELVFYKFLSDHPLFVKLYDYLITSEHKYIIMEYIPFNMEDLNIDQNTRFNLFIPLAYQLLSVINFMHKNNIYHADIKPDNILLDLNTGLIKVTDFDISFMNPLLIGQDYRWSNGGSPFFTPPENLSDYYCLNSDIWSVGACLLDWLILLTSEVKSNPYDMRKSVYNGQFLADLTDEEISNLLIKLIPENQDKARQINLISSLLITDYTLRPSASELLTNPIFSGLSPWVFNNVKFLSPFPYTSQRIITEKYMISVISRVFNITKLNPQLITQALKIFYNYSLVNHQKQDNILVAISSLYIVNYMYDSLSSNVFYQRISNENTKFSLIEFESQIQNIMKSLNYRLI